MTAMTTARPTIVRTMLPPPGPTLGALLAPESDDGRFSGVDSPLAASATGATSRQPMRAAASDRMKAGRIRTKTEGRAWIGLAPYIGRAAGALSAGAVR